MSEAEVNKEFVRAMARLAGVSIPEKDLEVVAVAFNRVLPALDEMMSVDLKDVRPTYQPEYSR